jgi:hypothetical protein
MIYSQLTRAQILLLKLQESGSRAVDSTRLRERSKRSWGAFEKLRTREEREGVKENREKYQSCRSRLVSLLINKCFAEVE